MRENFWVRAKSKTLIIYIGGTYKVGCRACQYLLNRIID
jgi:hypothetical protein